MLRYPDIPATLCYNNDDGTPNRKQTNKQTKHSDKVDLTRNRKK